MHRILLYLAFGICPGLITAQSDFTPQELSSFVHIYFQKKNNRQDGTAQLQALLSKHNISRDRYASLLKNKLTGEKEVLAENELEFIAAVNSLNQELRQLEESKLRVLCEEKQLPFEQYKKIETLYKKDIAFQRSIQSYFEEYLKKGK